MISPGKKLVAVALEWHIPAILLTWLITKCLFYFFQVKGLLDVPVASSGVSAIKILASVGVAVTGVAIISGIYLSSKRWAFLSSGFTIISGIPFLLARVYMADCWKPCKKWHFSCNNPSLFITKWICFLTAMIDKESFLIFGNDW